MPGQGFRHVKFKSAVEAAQGRPTSGGLGPQNRGKTSTTPAASPLALGCKMQTPAGTGTAPFPSPNPQLPWRQAQTRVQTSGQAQRQHRPEGGTRRPAWPRGPTIWGRSPGLPFGLLHVSGWREQWHGCVLALPIRGLAWIDVPGAKWHSPTDSTPPRRKSGLCSLWHCPHAEESARQMHVPGMQHTQSPIHCDGHSMCAWAWAHPDAAPTYQAVLGWLQAPPPFLMVTHQGKGLEPLML